MRLFLKRVFCQNAVFWKASFCCEITPGATTKTPWVALAGSHAGCNNWDCYRVTTHQHFWKSRCSFSVVVLTSFVAAGAVVVSSSGAVVADAVVVGSSRTVVDKSRCCYVFMIYCCWAVVLANSRAVVVVEAIVGVAYSPAVLFNMLLAGRLWLRCNTSTSCSTMYNYRLGRKEGRKNEKRQKRATTWRT